MGFASLLMLQNLEVSPIFLVYRQKNFSLPPPILDRSRVKYFYLSFNSLTRRGKNNFFFHLNRVMSLLALIQDRQPKQEFWWVFSSFQIVRCLCHGQNLAFCGCQVVLSGVVQILQRNQPTVALTLSELVLYIYVQLYLQFQCGFCTQFYISHT